MFGRRASAARKGVSEDASNPTARAIQWLVFMGASTPGGQLRLRENVYDDQLGMGFQCLAAQSLPRRLVQSIDSSRLFNPAQDDTGETDAHRMRLRLCRTS